MLSTIHVDAARLRHNFREFSALAGKQRLAPVLKSNAYGHGLRQVFEALAPESPEWLCVNYVSEARALRDLGFSGRLLVVGPTPARELTECAAIRAEVVIGNTETLGAWTAMPTRPSVHVKFDTGMGRQGFRREEAPALVDRLAAHLHDVAGVCTHFANVEDVTDHDYANGQMRQLEEAANTFKAAGARVLVHAASSASTLILPESRLDLERVGISLYGLWPSQATRISYLQLTNKLIDLKPALTWFTEVTSVKNVSSGEFIGYGCTFRANHDLKVAVLPVGYFEGYPRLAGSYSSYVLIHDVRCPIVGRICMNMMMVDATHVQGLAVGDRATLIGQDGRETVQAQDVAGWAQTIHYELLSRLHADIPRQLISQEREVLLGVSDDK